MNFRIIAYIVVLLLGSTDLIAQSGRSGTASGDWIDSQTWRSLSPLRSTRDEIEKKFGKPMLDSDNSRHAIYKDQDGLFSFIYSGGDCTAVGDMKWKVSINTLLRIDVYPSIPFHIPKTWFSEHKFLETKDLELHQIYYRKDGVSVTVISDDLKVFRVTYFPPSNNKDFQCQD